MRVPSSTRVGPTWRIAAWCDGAIMKPMPASRMQRSTPSGGSPILTPSARQRVGGARARRGGAIAVLGDRNAAGGDDDRGERRDIVGAGTVAAGADDVDRVGGRCDAQHLGAHRGDCAGDLVDAFAAHPQRHQEAAHLRRRHFARQHGVEGGHRFRRVSAAPAATLAIRGLKDSMRADRSAPKAARVKRGGQVEEIAQDARVRARSRCSRGGTVRRKPGGRGAPPP